jgi:hypothetical protein
MNAYVIDIAKYVAKMLSGLPEEFVKKSLKLAQYTSCENKYDGKFGLHLEFLYYC